MLHGSGKETVMKTLNTIQTLSKIGKIFSKIIYICCLVGIIGGAVGIIALLIGAETLKLGGMTLHTVLETEAGVGTGTVLTAIAVEIVLCIGEFFVSRMAYRYFENELKSGTPFTTDGAKELLHLGISTIWIPIVSFVLAQVTQGVIAQFTESVEKLDFNAFDSVALGVMFIVMSLLCKYGAELREHNAADGEKTQTA